MFVPFIFIVGVTDQRRPVARGERHACPVCDAETPHHRVEVRRRLTLFFIPVWHWNRREVLVCDVCGHTHAAPEDEAVPP